MYCSFRRGPGVSALAGTRRPARLADLAGLRCWSRPLRRPATVGPMGRSGVARCVLHRVTQDFGGVRRATAPLWLHGGVRAAIRDTRPGYPLRSVESRKHASGAGPPPGDRWPPVELVNVGLRECEYRLLAERRPTVEQRSCVEAAPRWTKPVGKRRLPSIACGRRDNADASVTNFEPSAAAGTYRCSEWRGRRSMYPRRRSRRSTPITRLLTTRSTQGSLTCRSGGPSPRGGGDPGRTQGTPPERSGFRVYPASINTVSCAREDCRSAGIGFVFGL